MRVFRHNSLAIPLNTWIQTVWDWRLPKRYYLSMYLKDLKSCRVLNFLQISKITFLFLCIILSYENSATYELFWFFQVLKIWQPVTLQHLEANRQVVPFWKLPISHVLEPGGHGGGRTFRAQNSHSKTWWSKMIFWRNSKLFVIFKVAEILTWFSVATPTWVCCESC